MKKVLVIGGSEYQNVLIIHLNKKGYKTYCVDKNINAIGFKNAFSYSQTDVCDFEECLKYAKANGVDAVMTYGSTIALPTVSYIGQKLGLPALPFETAEISKNKYAIKKRLAEFGANIKGDFFLIHSLDELANHNFDFPCVIKPSDGSGSKGVNIIKSKAELKALVENALNASRYNEVYYESFIEGKEYSAEVFVSDGKTYVYAILQTTFNVKKNNDISYGHKTVLDFTENEQNAVFAEIEKAVKALNITMGSVNFDIILDENNKAYIIDCGIRAGQNLIASHIVPYSRGVSIIDNNIYQALGETFDPTPKYQKCIASRLLIYKPGTISDIKPFNDLIGNNGIVDIVMKKNVGDTLRPYQDKSDTCGWVLCSGNTSDEAEKNAETAKEILKNYIIIR